MKPFNLEAAKRGDKLITRDECEGEIAYWDLGGDFPLGGKVMIKNCKQWVLCRWSEAGCFRSHGHPHYHDIFMAPVKQKLWLSINVEDERNVCFGSIYESKELAEAARGYFTKQIIEVEVEL